MIFGLQLAKAGTNGRKGGREQRAFAGRSCGPLRFHSETQIQNSKSPIGAQPAGHACDVKEQRASAGEGCGPLGLLRPKFKIQDSTFKINSNKSIPARANLTRAGPQPSGGPARADLRDARMQPSARGQLRAADVSDVEFATSHFDMVGGWQSASPIGPIFPANISTSTDCCGQPPTKKSPFLPHEPDPAGGIIRHFPVKSCKNGINAVILPG